MSKKLIINSKYLVILLMDHLVISENFCSNGLVYYSDSKTHNVFLVFRRPIFDSQLKMKLIVNKETEVNIHYSVSSTTKYSKILTLSKTQIRKYFFDSSVNFLELKIFINKKNLDITKILIV